jgi:predicted small integral membrane protein
MQTESPEAEPPKRKRRWFQFSLRTLMIFTMIVAFACGCVGWQAKIARGSHHRGGLVATRRGVRQSP